MTAKYLWLKQILKKVLTYEVLVPSFLGFCVFRGLFPNWARWSIFWKKVELGACVSAFFFAPVFAFEGWHHLLERLSVVLDFCAGFLIAPELIGLHRIARFEGWGRKKLSALAEWWPRAGRVWANDPIEMMIHALLIGGFGYLIQHTAFELHEWGSGIVVAIVYLLAANEGRLRFGGGAVGALKGIIICFFILTFSWMFIPWIILCQGFLKLTEGVLELLTGSERLRSYLVTAGVLSFILAKLLALIATFF